MRKIFSTLALFACIYSYSQPAKTCAVATDALKGTYTGDCKNDKADGTGTAVGTDSYTGEFKNGYPDGQGKYTWKNGDWYEGEWKKGSREGHGAMHYAEKAPGDSLAGFWKKDKYVGKYEKPYRVIYKTGQIGNINVSKENDSDKEISFTIKSAFGGAVTMQGQLPKIVITTINVENGLYLTRFDDNSNPKTSMTTLRNVTFPIILKMTLSSEDVLEMEFLEDGKYSVEFKTNK